MSVFYHNDDPLLHSTLFQAAMMNQNGNNQISDNYIQLYKQQLMNELQQQQQVVQQSDWLKKLDDELKDLDSTSLEILNNDDKFIMLNSQLQVTIQGELITLVRNKINSNENAINNIKEQMELIRQIKQRVKDEEKQNMNDINEYLKNYSHLTFDEYRKLKSGRIQEKKEEMTQIKKVKKV